MNPSSAHKALYLITVDFPYGFGDIFLVNELDVLARYFEKIVLLPLFKNSEPVVDTGEKVEVVDSLWQAPDTKSGKLNWQNRWMMAGILLSEFLATRAKIFYLKNIRQMIGNLGVNMRRAEMVERLMATHESMRPYCYSYWMEGGATTFAILKKKGVIPGFVSRIHGYDLYEYRRAGNYIPFRHFQMKMVHEVYTVSRMGQQYLTRKTRWPEKVKLSYLGVKDHGDNPWDPGSPLVLVSVANLIPIKRIHLIVEILRQLDLEVQWIHFGDGRLKEQLLESCKTFPPNVQYEFKGQIGNEALMSWYRQHPVHLLISVSETEGLPVSMMEAISFGIPVMGTDVGGVKEIVTSQTGFLIEKDFDPTDAAAKIRTFRNSDQNSDAFRKGVKDYWRSNFDAASNYQQFAENILALK